MELVNLDSSFRAVGLVENFDSLIWTERYAKAGDFELKSNNIAETMNALPLESYVTLRNTTVPMVVEAHKIHKSVQDIPELVVTGRSFEACALERRASVNSLPAASARSAWMMAADKESDAAYKAVRVVIGDVARSQGATQVLAATSPAVSANDVIPEIDLTLPADYSAGVTQSYEISPGVLYNKILELINTNNRGIKSVRPLAGEGKVAVEIYNGADRTATVVFDARFDQIDDSTYLLSNQGSTNVAYVYGSNGSQQVLKTTAPEPSGLSRRVLIVDESNDDTSNTSDIRKTRGLIELYKNNATALFDGEVAQQVAEGYNQSYFLGDIIKLVGEYGLVQNARVAEFIRTSDAEGEKSYPTFAAVEG